MITTAVILAGGLGTRLRPLTDEIPKPLVPIKNKPLLQHQIEHFRRNDVTNIILSVGYKEEQIKAHFGNGAQFGVKITYSPESLPLGTGGAIKQAAQGFIQPFFLQWGDNLMDIDWRKMESEYGSGGIPIIMALTPREDVENFGVAKLDGNKFISFVEKPKREDAPSKWINAGAFILHPEMLKILPEGKSSIEKDCFEKLAPQGKISAYFHHGQWFPTDTMEKYELAQRNFQPPIDFTKKRIIIADVDETICESCQQISPEMAEQINNMVASGYTFAFISGTKAEDLQNMISSRVNETHHILATTGTKYVLMENETRSTIYNCSLSQNEKEEILLALDKLIQQYQIISLTTKEDQVQDRDSQITLSAIGRHASSELKAKYDTDGSKRQVWIWFLKGLLGEKYDFKIGGTTSLDITQKGLDKEWGIRKFLKHHNLNSEQVLFMGDKIYPGGNDYPATKVVDCLAVKSPKDTLDKLKTIFK